MPYSSARSPQPAHPLGRGHHEAALALDGLEHDRGHVLGGHVRDQHAAQRLERLAGRVVALPPVRVRERRPVHLGGERAHAGLVGVLLGCQRHRHQGAAVEGALEGDHGGAAGRMPGDLDGVLDGLGARVEEGGLVRAGDRALRHQALGQLDVGLVGHDGEVGVQEAVDLAVQRLGDGGIRVADVQAADPARPVEEGVAVDVGDDAAVAVAITNGASRLLASATTRSLRARIARDLGPGSPCADRPSLAFSPSPDGAETCTGTGRLAGRRSEVKNSRRHWLQSRGWCCLTGRSARRWQPAGS